MWGRTHLAKAEVVKGLVSTLGASLVAFPVMWAVFGYCAGFNPQPKSSAMAVGGLFAGLLFPAYSALVAAAAFELRVQAARSRGAPARSLAVRAIAGLFLALVMVLALGALGVGCFLAAGPKALG